MTDLKEPTEAGAYWLRSRATPEHSFLATKYESDHENAWAFGFDRPIPWSEFSASYDAIEPVERPSWERMSKEQIEALSEYASGSYQAFEKSYRTPIQPITFPVKPEGPQG